MNNFKPSGEQPELRTQEDIDSFLCKQWISFGCGVCGASIDVPPEFTFTEGTLACSIVIHSPDCPNWEPRPYGRYGHALTPQDVREMRERRPE